MDLDTAISVAIGILAFASGYLGMHMTFYPPQSRKAIGMYQAGFITAGALTIGLLIWQGVRNRAASEASAAQTQSLQKDAAAARNEAASANTEASAAKTEVTKIRNELKLENARRQQAENDMALLITRTAEATRSGIAEDLKHFSNEVKIGNESIQYAVSFLETSETGIGAKSPFVTTFIGTTNKMVTPVQMLVQCDNPINRASGFIVGSGYSMSGGWGGKFNDRSYGFTIGSPAWTPSNPLRISVESNTGKIGSCRFRLRPP